MTDIFVYAIITLQNEVPEVCMNIGQRIRTDRIRLGKTQEELALELNISPQAVSRWECGASLPDIMMLPKLSKILHVSTDVLLCCDSTNDIVYGPNDVLTQSQIDRLIDNLLHNLVYEGDSI